MACGCKKWYCSQCYFEQKTQGQQLVEVCRHIDKVDVRHHTTAGKIPVGIKWLPEEWRVPEDYKKRLRLLFAGYVRIGTPLDLYPSLLGDGFELKPGKGPLDKQLWWNKWYVGDIIQNPNAAGFPHDGPGLPPSPEQKLLAAPKPASEKQAPSEHPGFGWDPGYGDD